MTFSNLANEVMKERKNFGAPTSMRLKDSVVSNSLIGVTITIDECIVCNRPVIDKDTKESKTAKDGSIIYNPVVFVAFNGDKFFACKSRILVTQIEKFIGRELVAREENSVTVSELKGLTVKIGAEKVKYKDGKMYDNIVFVDA